MGKGGLPPYQTISIFFLQKVLLVKNDLHALKHDVNTFFSNYDPHSPLPYNS